MAGRDVFLGSAAALMALTAALVPAPVLAQSPAAAATARDVGASDPLRPVLLNALRPAIVADLGQSVKFVVATLRIQGDWAYVVARPQRPDGREIDFRSTRYREAIDQGVFDGPTLYALMQRREQRWTVVDFVIGPTDVAWAGWPEEHGAPAALLGLPNP
ncbi:hypothetical protein [Brevundimonas sp.]|uniref:hypothetical protein n=1 Tax=Brevundimonas sp. TaxID=1871086 RepID=UPI0040338CA7